MTEREHHSTVQAVNVNLPRRGSSLGTASLILGVVALGICWIPLLGVLGAPLGGLGLMLGLVGIIVAAFRKGAGIGYPLAGTVVCGVALSVVGAMTSAMVAGIEGASQAATESRQQRNATNQQVVDDHVTTPQAQPAKAAPAPAVEWALATSPVRQGDVQVEVADVRVGIVSVKDIAGQTRESETPALQVTVGLTNLSQSRKLEYQSWAGKAFAIGRTSAVLTDNFGNTYKRLNYGGGSQVVGQVRASESLYPGKAVTDVLVFEPPLETAEYLNLQLPAKNFNGTGMVRLRIGRDMIQWQ